MISDLSFREAQVWIQTKRQHRLVFNMLLKIILQTHITPKKSTQMKQMLVLPISLYLKLNQVTPIPTKSKINDILQQRNTNLKALLFYENTPPPNIRIAILGSHYAVEKAFEPPTEY